MFGKEIESLLQKSLPALPAMVCAKSLKRDIDELVAPLLVGPLVVIDDRHTAAVLGDQVFRALKRFDAVHVTLPDMPAADIDTVDYIRRETAGRSLVAVGSGTINDICKYASFLDGKPYVVFPTAASMNGYVSANASIAVDGYKKTFAAHMPKAVFCDLLVIATAPVRLNKSGLGDSLARPTAQADWLLSHLLLNTPYDEVPFKLLAPLEPHLFEEARGIAKNDPQSIELLLKVLLLSGLGMTIAKGSYPASQGEHMIAHAMGMVRNFPSPLAGEGQGGGVRNNLHGEEIGVTTLTMARMQEKLLRASPALQPLRFPDAAIQKLFGKYATSEAAKAYHGKLVAIEKAGLDNKTLAERWENVAARIEVIRLSPERIHAILKAAEAPDMPESLGWNAKTYDDICSHARFLRDRFTFLDLAF